MKMNDYLTLKKERNKRNPKVVSLCNYRKTGVIRSPLPPDQEVAFRKIESLESEYRIIERMEKACLTLLKNHKATNTTSRIVYGGLLDSFEEVMIFIQKELDKVSEESSVPEC